MIVWQKCMSRFYFYIQNDSFEKNNNKIWIFIFCSRIFKNWFKFLYCYWVSTCVKFCLMEKNTCSWFDRNKLTTCLACLWEVHLISPGFFATSPSFRSSRTPWCDAELVYQFKSFIWLVKWQHKPNVSFKCCGWIKSPYYNNLHTWLKITTILPQSAHKTLLTIKLTFMHTFHLLSLRQPSCTEQKEIAECLL